MSLPADAGARHAELPHSAGEVSERGRSEREERSIARGLVIGAGIAGLTAARDLAVDGYDLALLEARERTGGRIWTSHDLGLPGHLGASWILGFEHNPIARLAQRHAIAIVRTNISSVTPARYRSMVIYDGSSTGSRLVMTFLPNLFLS